MATKNWFVKGSYFQEYYWEIKVEIGGNNQNDNDTDSKLPLN